MGKPVRRFSCVQKDVVKRDVLERGTQKRSSLYSFLLASVYKENYAVEICSSSTVSPLVHRRYLINIAIMSSFELRLSFYTK